MAENFCGIKNFGKGLIMLTVTAAVLGWCAKPGLSEKVIKPALAQQLPELVSVRIEPMEIKTAVGRQPIGLSALAYDENNQPIWTGVFYEWGISSLEPLGTLDPAEGPVASFLPLNPGEGSVWVIARQGDISQTLAIPVEVLPKGDLNNDGEIDTDDLVRILGVYGSTGAENDLSGDDKTNAVDFGTLRLVIDGLD